MGPRSGILLADSDFETQSQQSSAPVPDRSGVEAANLKKPGMIPPSEVRRAILTLATEQVGLREDELPSLIARVLGFKATSGNLKEVVDEALTAMLGKGEFVARGEKPFFRRVGKTPRPTPGVEARSGIVRLLLHALRPRVPAVLMEDQVGDIATLFLRT